MNTIENSVAASTADVSSVNVVTESREGVDYTVGEMSAIAETTASVAAGTVTISKFSVVTESVQRLKLL